MAAEEEGGQPRWLWLTLLSVTVLLVLGVTTWLLMGGANTVVSWLPEGVAKTLGERPGEGKRVEQKLTHYPGEQAPTEDGEEVDAEELQRLLGPLRDKAEATDAAIAALGGKHRPDQAAVLAAENAVDELKTFSLGDLPKAYRQPAEERRRAMVDERQTALTRLKKTLRATHLVTGTSGTALLELRKAADDQAESVTGLEDGTLVQVHLDTGKGWSRVDVLSGPDAGKGGYLQNGALQRLPPSSEPTPP